MSDFEAMTREELLAELKKTQSTLHRVELRNRIAFILGDLSARFGAQPRQQVQYQGRSTASLVEELFSLVSERDDEKEKGL